VRGFLVENDIFVARGVRTKKTLMPMFTRNKKVLKSHPTIIERGIKSLTNKIP
jgi:hypothetical protein